MFLELDGFWLQHKVLVSLCVSDTVLMGKVVLAIRFDHNLFEGVLGLKRRGWHLLDLFL